MDEDAKPVPSSDRGSGDPETKGRDHAGRFLPGVVQNPAGRTRGIRHAAHVALDAIGDESAKDVLAAVVKAALGGDMRAAEILMRRVWPERKGRPVALELPSIDTPAGMVAATGAIVGAVAAGEVTPEEGQAVAAIVEAHRRALETEDLERRLAVLEANMKGGG